MKTCDNFMLTAIEEAKKSDVDVPVGAVIVEGDKILAVTHNEKEKNNDISAHAEILALRQASKVKNNWRLENCTMYVTLEPCPMCASAIISSRLKEVYFGAFDNLYGALGSKIDLRKIYNSKLKVKGGICELKCSELLKNFWKGKNV